MNYLGIKDDTIYTTSIKLNKLLSNYQMYYQNLRRFHWNIKGKHFFDLHEKFEELYNDAKVAIDEIAERILTLRQKPISTLAKYLKNAEIKEIETEDSTEMVETILKNHSVLIEDMRLILDEASSVEDEGTIDMVAGFLSNIEKKSWMLDAWLNKN